MIPFEISVPPVPVTKPTCWLRPPTKLENNVVDATRVIVFGNSAVGVWAALTMRYVSSAISTAGSAEARSNLGASIAPSTSIKPFARCLIFS